jgi:hypothetical protein
MRQAGSVEGLVPLFDDRRWECAQASTTAQVILQEFVPQGDQISEWHELVTVQALAIKPSVALADYAGFVRSSLEARVVDGAFEWQILGRRSDALTYSWTLEDDVAAVDQLELVRVIRGTTALHELHYAIRAPLTEAAVARAQWLPRIESAELMWRPPPPARTAPPVPDAARVAFEALKKAPDPGTSAAVVSTVRRALAVIERASDPIVWAGLYSLLGNHLAGGTGDFEEAIAAYRRALEVYTLQATPELWARAMLRLGDTFAVRAHGDLAANEAHAAAAFRQALRVFSRGTEEWAETTIALAGVERSLETKEDLYEQVLQAFDDVSDFAGGPNSGHDVEAVVLATNGIERIDRMRGGEVILPPGFEERETRGAAVYLRPLITSGRLMLRNCFRNHAALVVQYEHEPDQITLEGVLNRILAPQFSLVSIGGRPEGYGPPRLVGSAGFDWKGLFNFIFDEHPVAPVLVLIVPHVSDGVRWEVEQLIARQALGMTLFVMPPMSERFDAGAMWTEGRTLLADHGLRLPAYDPTGMFVRLDPDGGVAESWPFEVAWSNTLVEQIEHLLPKPKGGG